MAAPAFDPESASGPATTPALPAAPATPSPALVVAKRCCADPGACSYPSCRCSVPLVKALPLQ